MAARSVFYHAMSWPLKLQGRLLTESQVSEVRSLLKEHPSWHWSRLSRELCERWNWRRIDGQMKDMAYRELLRKLEARSLINLPPRQRSGPGCNRNTATVTIEQSPVIISLSDFKPITLGQRQNKSGIRSAV